MIASLGWVNGGVVLAVVLVVMTALVFRKPTTEGNAAVRDLRPFPCNIEGCKGKRSARHLVCPACWRRVPKSLRSEFYKTWDQAQVGRPNGYLRWLAARQKCLESLQ